MADLQLVPNPTVLAVQTGVFLSAMVVVKKLYVDPFLELKQKRDLATLGNKDQASELLSKNETSKELIKTKIQQAAVEAQAVIAEAKKAAGSERDQILAAASKEADATMSSLRKAIADKLAAEKAKVPQVVAELSAKVFHQATH